MYPGTGAQSISSKKKSKHLFHPKREGVGSYLLACVYTLHPPLSHAPNNENFTENRKEENDKTIFPIHCAPASPARWTFNSPIFGHICKV